jgi:hypothetical protein
MSMPTMNTDRDRNHMFVFFTYFMQLATALAFYTSLLLVLKSYRHNWTKAMWINVACMVVNIGAFGFEFFIRARWIAIS